MRKIVKLFLLVCALAGACALGASAANAAITGRIGVGTWNTQAEFADVRVVRGTQTLYQSNFAAGMAEWTTSGGTWQTQDGLLRQTGGGTPALALVGDPSWSDYTLTLRARKLSGAEGFLITFGSTAIGTKSWWNIGGFNNTRHLLEVPGVLAPDVNGAIQTGRWYDIRVEIQGIDIRCYLDGVLLHDTARILDSGERTERFNQLINAPGFGLLNGIEQDGLRNLAGRGVYIGRAARLTFFPVPSGLTFAALSPAQQALLIRGVNRHRVTWNTGYGYGSDLGRDAEIIASVDGAVSHYNSLSVFDKHLTANNDPGVPTADANYDGWMRFGNSRNYRVALHEMGHTMGIGTHWRWGELLVNGTWLGQYGNMKLAEFDGAGAVIHGDTQHMWPYGLNFDNEYSDENARRHVFTIAAMRRDMGVADQVNWVYATNVPNGAYRLTPRHAQGSALDVLNANPNNTAPIGINTFTAAESQKFLFDLQPEGTYRIRTALPGNRAVELPGGNTNNGSPVQLWDDNGLSPQRWLLIPTDSGFYKIAPLNNTFKGMDVAGISTADGSRVQSWDYLDGFNQQWRLTPSAEVSYVTAVPSGTYRLTPRHAQGSALTVLNANPANAAPIGISTYAGANSQRFALDVQSDGSYRIRTALAGNRAVELPSGITDNGTKTQLWDDNGASAQRWLLIPTDNGFYKIAPKNNLFKSMDVDGVSTANGALVQSWEYLSGGNQQWSLVALQDVSLDLSTDAYTVAENAGQATITVVRTGNLAIPVSVNYATGDGGAIQPGDYTATSGTLSFAANETTKTFTVSIANDSIDEEDETVRLTLSNPTNGAILGARTTATLTITDEDTAGITVTPTSGLTTEAGGTATFTVRLNSQPMAAVTIPLGCADKTKGTVSPAALVFTPANWSTAQTVTITGRPKRPARGNLDYSIMTAPASSSDARYSGMDAADVAVTAR